MRRIRITAGGISVTAELNDSPTADAIWNVLPLEARGSTWGDEIYFPIPVHLPPAKDAKEVVELGDLGYWPPGNAFCIFYGPTPASVGDEIRPASPVSVFGHIVDDPTVFRKLRGSVSVRVERIEERL
ncbi:MAG: cyclophilin-like fold protein [Anaerolineae bacterium]